jgi:methylated-DNA-protein-cysteine methyltransferase related protein
MLTRSREGIPAVSANETTQRILAAVRALRRGQTASYGEIARRAGLPRRARLVARVLSNNDDPDLPWHRVLRADGRIAFPPGSAGHAEQLRRLKAEGVTPGAALRRAAVDGLDLDAALWRPPGGSD